MDLTLTDKTVLVTGASKGIGLATATAFAAEGARLTLVARDAARLEAAAETVAAATGHRPGIFAADLGTDAGRSALHGAVPTPDVLVNNAGAIKAGRLADLTMADWRTGWELKVFGYIHLCQLFYPDMAARGAGVIVNVIGMGGRAVRPAYICGAAGNAALIGFTQALGAEAQGAGVRVLGVNPSPTLTDRMTQFFKGKAQAEFGDEARWQELVDPEKFPYGRPKSPQEVAALCVMMASPRIEYLNGTVIDMDGGGQWTGRI
ncbi:SDR family oxidoreductase [Dinoroseobacter sp. PD6]|uniref:SDR family oxidoreductase n=1 Tax=Dinoroseobacter sp. PD6 TaxID=3028384 RepID=UPI00237B2B59|nr:SDR family oxidoreductase [Dinoroseobacter sp. PD6]MDD9715891.1 SDR family oxidoreductase [Dinoroseobacter sp. PD6]